MTKFNERLRLLRKENHLSQQDLAKRIGVSKSSINMYERGEREPGLEALEAIADYFNVDMDYLLGKSEHKNKAAWLENEQSAFKLYPYHPTHRIPILGRISAGKPLFAEENIEGYTYTELNSGGTYYALRVAGDSMNAARINDGDLLIVRQQDEVENGQIAIVMVNGHDATVKKYYRNGDTVTLLPQSFNPEHQMQVYDLRKTQVKVLGLVVQNVIKM